ncbi:hypothetical protein IAD21_06313 [Abditibacteriota bacterium]|nr:hypothetical protein IAD21_06313 [Abditibacteriota bacterium]
MGTGTDGQEKDSKESIPSGVIPVSSIRDHIWLKRRLPHFDSNGTDGLTIVHCVT